MVMDIRWLISAAKPLFTAIANGIWKPADAGQLSSCCRPVGDHDMANNVALGEQRIPMSPPLPRTDTAFAVIAVVVVVAVIFAHRPDYRQEKPGFLRHARRHPSLSDIRVLNDAFGRHDIQQRSTGAIALPFGNITAHHTNITLQARERHTS